MKDGAQTREAGMIASLLFERWRNMEPSRLGRVCPAASVIAQLEQIQDLRQPEPMSIMCQWPTR